MKQTQDSAGPKGKQTNLAEGERDIIEESIRAHEQKGDLNPGNKGKEKGNADNQSGNR